MKSFLKTWLIMLLALGGFLFWENFAVGADCSFEVNTTQMMSSSCSISSNKVRGVDGGNLTISDSTTLTLESGSILVFNPGRQITVSGTILIDGSGAQIRKGYLCVMDNDGDGWYEGDIAFSNSSTCADVAQNTRLKDAPNPNDCDDNDPAYNEVCCVCSSGACCDGCFYEPSSYVCSTWTEYNYRCAGSNCGDDAQRQSRTNNQYCSGSSSSCDGTISYGAWSSWSTIDDCVTTEKCRLSGGVSECYYASECDISNPTVQTNSATSITTNSARLNGNLTNMGGASSVEVRFEWGTSSSNLNYSSSWVSRSSTGTFYYNLSSLSSNTTYYFRAVARNSAGTSYGSILSFKTCSCSSGACCDGCYYRPSSYVCNTWTEYDYRCTGSNCGNDAQRQSRTNNQYCSGSSSSCNGTISYGAWSSWSTIDNCGSTEKCRTDNATYSECYYASECDVTRTRRLALCGENCNSVCSAHGETCIQVELYPGWATYFCAACDCVYPGCSKCLLGVGASCGYTFRCDPGIDICEGAHPDFSYCLCEG